LSSFRNPQTLACRIRQFVRQNTRLGCPALASFRNRPSAIEIWVRFAHNGGLPTNTSN
jgi:hypothetical protein